MRDSGTVLTLVTSDSFSAFVDRLRELLAAGRAGLEVPGAAVAVVRGDEEAIVCDGHTSLQHPLPVDAHTLFGVGSITKTFSAAALLRLAADRHIALDQRVVGLLPELRLKDPEATAELTLAHLLTHTGGWDGDYFRDTGWGDDALARILPDLGELRQHSPVGTTFSYNNAAFYVVGRLIERMSDRVYEDHVTRTVLHPLGMRHTFFFPQDLLTHRHAIGHVHGPSGLQPTRPWVMPRSAAPAGGLVSCASDLLSYLRFHLLQSLGNDVLDRPTRAAMTRPRLAAGEAHDAVGLVWMLDLWGTTKVVSHGGAAHGQPALVALFPEHDVGLAVLTNADSGARLGRDVMAWAANELFGAARPEPAVDRTIAINPALIGTYATYLRRLHVELDNGTFTLRVEHLRYWLADMDPRPSNSDPMILEPYGGGCYVVGSGPLSGERLETLVDPSGHVRAIRVAGRVHPRTAALD